MSTHVVNGKEDLAAVIGVGPSEPFPHLWTRLCEHANDHPSHSALSFPQPVSASLVANGNAERVVWTYSYLQAKAESLAARLFSLGIRKGDAIAVFLDNRAEWALLFWVAVRLDAVFVPLNPRMIASKEEAIHVLQVTKPSVLVVLDENDADALDRVAVDLMKKVSIRITLTGSSLNNTAMHDLMAIQTHTDGDSIPPAVNDLNQTMTVIFTSGTTSLPKASFSTYQNLIAGASACKTFRHLDPDSVLLQHLPVFHSWSICMTLAYWITGATVIYPAPTFDARASLSAIGSEKCTHLPAVPSMIHALITHPSLSKTNLESLHSIDLAGTMVLPEIITACMDKLKAPFVSASYGMTECNFVSASDIYNLPFTRNNIPEVIPCGTAAPGGRLRVCRPKSRHVLRRGEVGELHVGGLQVTKGYLDSESDDFYNEDGIDWLVTGDQAQIDDGNLLYILGRYKDLIIRGGENVSPALVERCLDSLIGITGSQVIGIPNEIAGEVPVAIVTKGPQAALSYYQIQHKISQELGKVFSPHYIFDLHDDLRLSDYPRTTSGKIKKRHLKSIVLEHMARANSGERNGGHVYSTIDSVIRIWARVSGRTANDISPEECADTFADSIMMMQFCNTVGKDLSKSLAVEDLRDVTISKQAQIIDARPIITRPSARASNTGPPEPGDMIHVHGDEAAKQCQQQIEDMLRPHGLEWDDVEDVIPTSQRVGLVTHQTRRWSFNRRHTYHVPNASVEDLQWAVMICLELHPILRSMIYNHGKEQPLYIILRPNHRWQQVAISQGYEVDNPEDLKRLQFNDNDRVYATPPGPLFKIMIVAVRSTDAAGLIFTGHHSTYDASSLAMWFEDLDTALRTHRPPKAHADFKLFAKSRYRYIDSSNANEAVNFHVSRLKGYTNYRSALFPPQRAPQFFHGDDSEWRHVDGTPGKASERQILDSDPQGWAGISSSITLPALSKIKLVYGITANIVFKAAVAIQNIHHTNSSQAFFGQTEAARAWPCPTGSPDPALPNTMDIAGPTWQGVINRIHIDRSQKILPFLEQLHGEQRLLTKYAQAPFLAIEAALTSSSPPMIDHELYNSVFRRQCFNWLPPLHAAHTRLKQVQVVGGGDIGLHWNFRHVDVEKGVVGVNVGYDDCQLRSVEVKQWIEEVFEAVEWICAGVEGVDVGEDKGNDENGRQTKWEERKMGECTLLNKQSDSIKGDEWGWAVE
ncbi:MAG: hypothetical protein Q9182_002772 [Xanthomendoza sp. 2 TL-2023]